MKDLMIKRPFQSEVKNIMRRWLVNRPKDEVVVAVMKNKVDNTYSFINLTKEHICPCKFESIDDALKDMDEKVENGEINYYFELR